MRLVLGQTGTVLYADFEEKLIAKLPGQMNKKKMKEAVKAHAEYLLEDLEPRLKISLENVVNRDPEEINEILARTRA